MRTISAKHPKGQEPPRTLGDNLRLIHRIVSMGVDYVVTGHRIRKEFYRKQQLGEKIYIDEVDWL